LPAYLSAAAAVTIDFRIAETSATFHNAEHQINVINRMDGFADVWAIWKERGVPIKR